MIGPISRCLHPVPPNNAFKMIQTCSTHRPRIIHALQGHYRMCFVFLLFSFAHLERRTAMSSDGRIAVCTKSRRSLQPATFLRLCRVVLPVKELGFRSFQRFRRRAWDKSPAYGMLHLRIWLASKSTGNLTDQDACQSDESCSATQISRLVRGLTRDDESYQLLHRWINTDVAETNIRPCPL